MEAYAERCASALYLDALARKPLGTVDAFRQAAMSAPAAAAAWIARLRSTGEDEIARLIAEVPRERCSTVAQEFATRIVLHNRARLLGYKD